MTITGARALELGQVLGSLLDAVVDAQAASASTTAGLVEDLGFQDGRMRTAELLATRRDEAGEAEEVRIEVPVLALVHLPSLAVGRATLTFAYDVVAAREATGDDPRWRPPALLRGIVQPRQEERTGSIDVEVILEHADAPLGIERLGDLAELGMVETRTQRFLGNVNHLEVHDTENATPRCQLDAIKPDHRRWYPSLEDARADLEYDNCAWCLGGSLR